MEHISDEHVSILGNRKKVCYKYNITDFLYQKSFDIISTLYRCKNGPEWLKYKCPSDIISFRCLLLKADFRIFYFELETLLNILVQLCGYFFQKT